MERKSSVFDPSVFSNPPNTFRPLQIVHGLDNYLSDPANLEGLPGLAAFLEKLANLGTGGIVTNVGFRDYLVSSRQWEILRHGLQKADSLGLRLWLYDEKGYPSGTAGGIVTRSNPDWVALGLACYPIQVEGPSEVNFPMPVSCRKFVWAGASQNFEAATGSDVIDLSTQVDEWGCLCWSAPAGRWTVLYLAERVMYEGTHAADNVHEFKHYINLLDPEPVRAFLRVTHEAYVREIPPETWKKIEAIFTDEPSLMTFYLPPIPERFWGKIPVLDGSVFTDRPMAVPWSRNFFEKFHAIKGYDLCPSTWALFFSSSDDACAVRQDYYEAVTRLYTGAFYEQVLAWCQAHGIASSGHLLLEEDIADHVSFHGSMFAPLRKMDLPGIDMLNADPQALFHGGSFMGEAFMAIKYATSAAHIAGRERIHSENSDWEQGNQDRFASLPERRGQANLQYVLGLNHVTSYYGWKELGEDAQRSYNEYIGRIGSLLTGGQHVCDVGVLYPIRTLWSHFLPPLTPMKSWSERPYRSPWVERIARGLPPLVKSLLSSQIDMDLIDEEAIVEGEKAGGALHLHGEAYRGIILPPLDALSLETACALSAFVKAGGLLISVGPLPRLADSSANGTALQEELSALFDTGKAKIIDPDLLPAELRRSLAPDFSLPEANPEVLYTHRVLEGRHVYFVINNTPDCLTIQPSLSQPGPYKLYEPLSGQVSPLAEPLSLEMEGYGAAFIVC
jgi:hypothetical protein